MAGSHACGVLYMARATRRSGSPSILNSEVISNRASAKLCGPDLLPEAMAELEKERAKLAKQDRKEANGLLEKVIEDDEPRVKQKLGVGANPDAFIDYVKAVSRWEGLA